jgi:DNA-binding PadR family transcriptional regulator
MDDTHWRFKGAGRFGGGGGPGFGPGGPPFGPGGPPFGPGGPPFGRGGPPFGPGGFRFGGPPFGPGQMFGGPGRGRRRRGMVRVALLMLLAEEPRNGYQLMQAIEERSGGRWRPSPGAVYPSLAQLEDEGLIRATDREGTKVFEITDAGQEHLEHRGEQTPPWVTDDDSEAFADLRSQMKQTHIAAMQVAHAGHEDQIARAADALSEARRKIYLILAEEDRPGTEGTDEPPRNV